MPFGFRISALASLWLCAALVALPVRAQEGSGFSLARYDRLVAEELNGAGTNYEVGWFLTGMADGFDDALTWYRHRGGKPLFCPPSGFLLTATNLRRLIDRELSLRGAAWRQSPEVDLEKVAWLAMLRIYPCR